MLALTSGHVSNLVRIHDIVVEQLELGNVRGNKGVQLRQFPVSLREFLGRGDFYRNGGEVGHGVRLGFRQLLVVVRQDVVGHWSHHNGGDKAQDQEGREGVIPRLLSKTLVRVLSDGW